MKASGHVKQSAWGTGDEGRAGPHASFDAATARLAARREGRTS